MNLRYLVILNGAFSEGHLNHFENHDRKGEPIVVIVCRDKPKIINTVFSAVKDYLLEFTEGKDYLVLREDHTIVDQSFSSQD